jgi:hypothetical protein
VAQLVNQYVYTMANPVMFWDPTGFESMFLGIAGYAGDMTGAYYGGAYGAGVGAAVGGPPGAVIGGVIGAGLGAFGGRVIFLTVGQFMFQVMNPGQRGIGGPKELLKNAVPFQPIQTEGDRAGMQNGKQAAYDPSASWWQRNACPVGCARPKFTGALGGLTLDFGGGFGGMPGGAGPCGINIELALVVPLLQALHRRKQRRSALRGPLPA